MKKSEIYFLAQMAVLLSGEVNDTDKLLILRELISQEDLALYCERRDGEENAE